MLYTLGWAIIKINCIQKYIVILLQIASSTKKLWGVEEGKEDGPKGILNLNDHHHQMWRDSTWSTNCKFLNLKLKNFFV